MNAYANNLRHMAGLARERGDDAARIVIESAATEIDRLEAEARTLRNLGVTQAEQMDALRTRVSLLEETLRRVVAWETEIELAAPDLDGCIKAMWNARDILGENR